MAATKARVKRAKSTVKKVVKTRAWTTIIYPESAPENWRQILSDQHMQIVVSPEHNADVNADGSPKKPHRHVVFLSDGPCTALKMQKISDQLSGVKVQPVNSVRSIMRYLCHMDNPEKAQYKVDDVIVFGGFDYQTAIMSTADDDVALVEIFDFIVRNHVRYFTTLVAWCGVHRRDWFRLITAKRTVAVSTFFHSLDAQLRDEERGGAKESLATLEARVKEESDIIVDKNTGEIEGEK